MAKTTNLMYRLNVQVTAYGRQTVYDRGVVRSCDPLQNFGSSNYITGMTETKVVKFCTRVGDSNSMQQDDILPTKGAWLWSRDCLKILPFFFMLRVAQICQRQLIYLFIIIGALSSSHDDGDDDDHVSFSGLLSVG